MDTHRVKLRLRHVRQAPGILISEIRAAIARHRAPRTAAAALAAIREHHAALGCPLDDLTDDDIREGVARLGAVVGSAGVPAAQAARQLAAAMAATRGPTGG